MARIFWSPFYSESHVHKIIDYSELLKTLRKKTNIEKHLDFPGKRKFKLYEI